MASEIFIIGGGGHARVLIDALTCLGRSVTGVVDPGPLLRALPDDVAWITDESAFLSTFDRSIQDIVIGIALTPSSNRRIEIWTDLARRGIVPPQVLHPSSTIAASVALGQGVQIMAGAIVQTGARLGNDVLVNTGAIVDHDVVVDTHSHIAPRAVLLGGVSVGRGAFVGCGALVRQERSVGAGAIVGMGSVVLEDVPPGVTVTGVWPGKSRSASSL